MYCHFARIWSRVCFSKIEEIFNICRAYIGFSERDWLVGLRRYVCGWAHLPYLNARVTNSVTERNSYGLGYHNRQLDSRTQTLPICNRNKMSNTKGSNLIPYLDGWSRSLLSFPTPASIDKLIPQQSVYISARSTLAYIINNI